MNVGGSFKWYDDVHPFFAFSDLTSHLIGTATDMIYFARSKFSRSLDHKKNFSLIQHIVFNLGYIFCQKR